MRNLNQGSSIQDTHLHLFSTSSPPIFLSPQATTHSHNEDIDQCKTLMQSLLSAQPQLIKKAEQILEQVNQGDYNKGIGYYNSKNLLLLEYLIQLQFYQLFKINGQDLTTGQGLELYKRLAYLKTVLIKLSPVEKKLEYQKNKLLKYSDVVRVKPQQLAISSKIEVEDNDHQQDERSESQQGEQVEKQQQAKGQSDEEDVLAYQPRPQALMKVKQKKQAQQQNEGKYIAPKMSAVLSREDKKRRKEQIQQQRKKVFLIRKFRDDLEDDEEARDVGVGSHIAEKIKRRFKQKMALEEENFMRLPETKQEKYWKKSLIRESQKSNPLQDELKDIQMIREIFTQKRQEQRPSSKPLKRKAQLHKPKAGFKKIKKNQ